MALDDGAGVLVVDDDHAVRVLVQLGLEQRGVQVWAAANGRQAVDLFQQHRERISLVLLDVLMPGIDGPGTLEALQREDPNVLACFMSGNTGVYTVEELIRRGAAHVIAKPFRLDELCQVLGTVVDGRSAASAWPSD